MEVKTENTTLAHIRRIREILGPIATLYMPATPPLPACTCGTGTPCQTCQGYNDAGNALESAAAALKSMEAQ